jgi:hypothetical protein
MVDYPKEVHEITAVQFAACGNWTENGPCPDTRRFAIRRQHLGLFCGAEFEHAHEWPTGKLWQNAQELKELGIFEDFGIPGDAFGVRTRSSLKKRIGGWDLSPNRRTQVLIEIARSETKCMLCDNTWFRGDRNSRESLKWLLRAEPRRLYPEVVDAVNKMMPKPTPTEPNWFDRLTEDLKAEVRWRFDDSRLVPDHPFSIKFLRAAKLREGRRFTEAVKRFGVDTLAMPLCDACNHGRGARLFENRDDLLKRWAIYQFADRTKKPDDAAVKTAAVSAKNHPEYKYFVYLADLAYESDLAEKVDAATPPRKSATAW